MKILVIFTGGTIGSLTMADGYVKPDEAGKYVLLDMYEKRRVYDVLFETECPYMVLSENLNGENINCLSECVFENIKKDYDGIIITHGTDTLQYSAAAISYSLGNLCKPVVFVSSDYILTDDRQNGVDNFFYAVSFICQKGGKGVFVMSSNSGEETKVHRASRLLRHSEFSNRIESLCGQYYGYFDKNCFVKNKNYFETDDEAEGFGALNCDDECFIQIIRPYPNFLYPDISKKTKAVLHESFHSGTVCTNSLSLEKFCEELRRNNINIYLLGNADKNIYDSTREYEKLGLCALPFAANVAMYMKLWIILSHGLDTKLMYKSIGADILRK